MLKQNTMKQLLLYLTFFLTITVVHGQKQGNIWYFGNKAGVDFNTGSPTALLNGQLAFPIGYGHNEGTSSIADSSGSLLFYSDGMTVWNKNHQVMQNGTGLLGNFSSTQSSIIVPDPANPNRYYYLFTVGSEFCCGGNISDGLRYSKIDICLDYAKGGINTTEKNIKLVDTVAEKIAVTRHSNKTDYWVLTHKFYSSEFWALHLSNNGIIDTVITAIGAQHTGSSAGSQGQLKSSPNGERIAIGANNGLDLLEVFDFDKTTGVVSNCLSLYKPNNDKASIYGVEFSSDNSILYVSGMSSSGVIYSFLVQYDLNAGGGSLTAINSSMSEIYHNTGGIVGGRGLQIAPDNKIYWISSNISNPSGTLAVVNNPNILGLGCNYQDQSVSLGGRQGFSTLPSFIAGFDYSNNLIKCRAEGIDETSEEAFISVYPNPVKIHTTLKSKETFENATLTVYNSYGQQVNQIKNVFGTEVTLYRGNLSSGLYFVRLTQENKQMVTMKLIIAD